MKDFIPKVCEVSPEGCIDIVVWKKGNEDDEDIDDEEGDDVEIGEGKWVAVDVGLITACLILEAEEMEADGGAYQDVVDPEAFGYEETADGEKKVGEDWKAIGCKG